MRYKYLIETSVGEQLYNADPFAFYAEQRPCTATIVHELDYNCATDAGWKSVCVPIISGSRRIFMRSTGSWRQHPRQDERETNDDTQDIEQF